MSKDKHFVNRLNILIAQFDSASEFARKVGIPVSTIMKWTKGNSEPTRDRLLKIAQAVDVDLDWLMFGHAKVEPCLAPLPSKNITKEVSVVCRQEQDSYRVEILLVVPSATVAIAELREVVSALELAERLSAGGDHFKVQKEPSFQKEPPDNLTGKSNEFTRVSAVKRNPGSFQNDPYTETEV